MLSPIQSIGQRPLVSGLGQPIVHVTFDGSRLVDLCGNAWTQVGTVPQTKSVPAQQNLILQSQALATSPWATFGSTAAAPTVSNNTADVTAPDGTSTASKIVYPNVLAGQVSDVYQINDSLGNGVSATASVWLRCLSGTSTVYLDVIGSGLVAGTVCNLTSSWQRFTLSVTKTTSTNWIIGVDSRVANNSPQGAQTVYAWGFQLESGSTANAYIPTTTAAVLTTSPLPPGAGPFTDSNYYSLGNGTVANVMNFAGDFTCVLVVTIQNPTSPGVLLATGIIDISGYYSTESLRTEYYRGTSPTRLPEYRSQHCT